MLSWRDRGGGDSAGLPVSGRDGCGGSRVRARQCAAGGWCRSGVRGIARAGARRVPELIRLRQVGRSIRMLGGNSTRRLTRRPPHTRREPQMFELGTDGPLVIMAGVDGTDSSHPRGRVRRWAGAAAEREAGAGLHPALSGQRVPVRRLGDDRRQPVLDRRGPAPPDAGGDRAAADGDRRALGVLHRRGRPVPRPVRLRDQAPRGRGSDRGFAEDRAPDRGLGGGAVGQGGEVGR